MPWRIDSFKIDAFELVGERMRIDGYLSRTGVQVYDQGDGTVQREQRDASEVFHKDALASMRAMPVTIGHPLKEMVNGDNWQRYWVAHVGDDVRPALDGIHTQASIWIIDSQIKERIKSKDLTELSVGYYANIDDTPGRNDAGEDYDVRQINIRGNHLALLHDNEARGGPGCRLRLDANGNACYPEIVDNNLPLVRMQPTAKEKRMTVKFIVKADGYDHTVEAETDALAVALEKERDATNAKIDTLEKETTDLKADLAKITAERDDAKEKADQAEKAATEANSPSVIANVVDELIKVRDSARVVAGKDIEYPSDVQSIKTSALKAAGITEIDGTPIEEKGDAYIDARFDIELQNATQKQKKTDSLSKVRQEMNDNKDFQHHETFNLTGALHDRLSQKGN
jgi:hypothetical protein